MKARNERKQLAERFSGFLNAIENLNYDSIINYSYPGLWKFVDTTESFQAIYRSLYFLDGKTNLDWVKADSLFPIIQSDKGLYTLCTYSFSIHCKPDSIEPDTKPVAFIKDASGNTSINHQIGINDFPAPSAMLMIALMRNRSIIITTYEVTGGIIHLQAKVTVVAAKDQLATNWRFMLPGEDQELLNSMYSKETLEKLSTFNLD